MDRKWKRFSFLLKEEPMFGSEDKSEVHDSSSTDTADEGPAASYKYQFPDPGKVHLTFISE